MMGTRISSIDNNIKAVVGRECKEVLLESYIANNGILNRTQENTQLKN